jgi:hypothetical protein
MRDVHGQEGELSAAAEEVEAQQSALKVQVLEYREKLDAVKRKCETPLDGVVKEVSVLCVSCLCCLLFHGYLTCTWSHSSKPPGATWTPKANNWAQISWRGRWSSTRS